MFLLYFAGFNQAYFMGLFFLFAGYFTTPSYQRKKAAHYLLDRTARLLLPLAVYDLVLQPLVFYMTQGGADPNK
jgi:fucose 4-O-acetylase-like acetyltransferase